MRYLLYCSLNTLISRKIHNFFLEDFYYDIAGYSGADVASLCSEAAMGPIRNISIDEIKRISSDKVSHYYCD